MYPPSLVFDFLQKSVADFRSTFESATEDSLERAKTNQAGPVAKSRLAYLRTTLVLPVVSLLCVGAFLLPGSYNQVTPVETELRALACQKMTASIQEGKIIPGAEAAFSAANIDCTKVMMETSQLCRDKCTEGYTAKQD